MQCPSCQFENMPGSGRCARCGGLLALATAAIDVHPPRAGRLSRRMPRLWGRFWSLRQSWANVQASLTRPFTQLVSRFDNTDFRLGTILRTIVPGWAHHYRGNNPRALIFVAGYLALMFPALLFLGTPFGSLMLGLAFGMHVAAASDALVGRFATIGDRLAFAFVCAAVLAIVLYVPIGRGISRVAVPIRLTQPVAPFRAGEVLWYNPTAEIVPGDFVLYQVPEMRISGGNHRQFVLGNQWINRVLAIPGQRVRLKGDQVFVDGTLSPWQPASSTWGGIESEFVVPDGQLFIPPNSLAPAGAQVNDDIWRRLGLVSRSRINGRIFFRSIPTWRISTMGGIE